MRVATGTGACTLASEERCTESVCPSPLVCRDDRCQAQCLREEDCLASQRCDGTVCVGRDVTVPDAGTIDARPEDRADAALDAGLSSLRPCPSGTECAPDELCADDFSAPVCRHRCTDHSDCPSSSVCDWYFEDGVDGGVGFGCSTVCVPGTSAGCPTDRTCRITWRDNSFLTAGPLNLTLCAPFEPRGAEGCPCLEPTSSHGCAPGLICRERAAMGRCLRVCVEGEECSPGVLCDTGSDGVTVEGITYGSCPEIAEPSGCPTPR